jgi:uncharacterized membrane protein
MTDPVILQARHDAWNEAKRKATEAADHFNKIQQDVLEARVAFYERLALFDAGTIAATITFVASLREHQSILYQNVLFSGWILLLVAMGLCFVRNSSTHAHLYFESAARYQQTVSIQREAEANYFQAHESTFVNDLGEPEDSAEVIKARQKDASLYKEKGEKFASISARKFKLLILSERCAAVLTTAGILCMLVFTVGNLRRSNLSRSDNTQVEFLQGVPHETSTPLTYSAKADYVS